MRKRNVAADVTAGMLLSNAMPHLIMGVAGKRMLTPGRPDSSPTRNLVWAGLNLVGGALLLGVTGWGTASQEEAERRMVAVAAGMLLKDLSGLGYELTLGPGRAALRRGRH
ncbi:hypothetical protein ACQEU5_07430 [Marinactinospora thermotolerans]|uniref:Uncharacterized protein n=1 Tax=Marinactinospora thermotolerans DSM 45154 TaxID=1122192 RepID=A0A1T4R3N3_9ACTN|nr:hypothetical protein [Marinactinospora thermotolerans]SKA10579.1 hypothetical protein SAMN02745673_02489 [Marinactinospora thermotolerans DSM 45154]